MVLRQKYRLPRKEKTVGFSISRLRQHQAIHGLHRIRITNIGFGWRSSPIIILVGSDPTPSCTGQVMFTLDTDRGLR